MSALRQAAWKCSLFIANNGGFVSRAIYRMADIYTKAYNNLNYSMEENGELRVLNRLASRDFKTVFDVGANRGDYTALCLARFPSATIHSFEIVPATFKKISENVKSDRAILNDIGLSNSKGSFELNFNPDNDYYSSLVEGNNTSSSWKKIIVNTITGDEYCSDRHITSIDLLKIDVEGAEHMVLAGFKDSFERGAISVVQFEFGLANIYSKFLLKDYWDFFGKHGFVLGPIMPTGVAFRDYNELDENFQGPPNFLAVRKTKTDLIEAVCRGR
jgi:FkbM family methyltransferase